SIGSWVMKNACRQMKEWTTQGLSELCVSVNVSVRQIQQTDFIESVVESLTDTGVDASNLEIEITENIMQNIQDSIRILHALKSVGVKITIDDFGIGYSSLYMLQKLPIDAIKIDKSFIQEGASRKERSIAKTIIEMGHLLNIEIVMEGIETERQIDEFEP